MRILRFVLAVLAVWFLLGFVPLLNASFFRLWISVILASVAMSAWGRHALAWRRSRNERSALEAVDTPNNRGKLGAMLLKSGSAKKAIPHLLEAREGEPEILEWNYRLGCAYLEVRRYQDAVDSLALVVATDAEYAYGSAQMRHVEALQKLGRDEEALEALDVFDRNHGESPESAYRRGKSLRAVGRGDEARRAFARVRELASKVAGYQKGTASGWAFRSLFGGLL